MSNDSAHQKDLVSVTPLLIPNTKVKPHSADGTARATEWKRRKICYIFRGRSADGSQRFTEPSGAKHVVARYNMDL